jgi:hypothetical protein
MSQVNPPDSMIFDALKNFGAAKAMGRSELLTIRSSSLSLAGRRARSGLH